MKKTIFLMMTIFLLTLPMVFSIASEIILHEGFETAGNQNFTLGANTGVSPAGMLTISASSSGATSIVQMINLSTNTNNFSCEWQMNSSGIGNTFAWLTLISGNNTGDFDDNRQWYGNVVGGDLTIHDQTGGAGESFSLGAQSLSFKNYTLIFYLNTSVEGYVDGVFQGMIHSANSNVGNWTYFKIFAQNGGIGMDNFTCYNGTSKPAEALPPDITIPSFGASSINNSAPKINEIVLLSQVVQDETALSSYRLATNLTGNFINSSAFGISGTSQNATFNLTINLTKGNVIAFIWHVEDSSGNANTTAIDSFTVANTAPESATILSPNIGINVTNSRDFNVTSLADADGDTLTYNYYINGTINSSSTGNVTFTGSDGTYQLNVEVNDGEASSANVSITFALDTSTPIITITLPLNASSHSTDIPIDISCSDNNPFRLNYTMSNASDVIKSVQNNTAIGSPIIIKDSINISGVADGDYNFDVTCVDTHTSKSIGDYFPYKDIGNLKLHYTIQENNEDIDNIGIKLKSTTATLDDFGTYKETDRYVFWFDFAEEESANVYEYVFKITNNNELMYLSDSDYNAHFVTGNNWIDFEFDDNEDAVYSVKQTANGKYEVKILTTKTYLHFKSIGGLNIATESVTVTIDTTAPAVVGATGTLGIFQGVIAGALGAILSLFIIIDLIRKRKSK